MSKVILNPRPGPHQGLRGGLCWGLCCSALLRYVFVPVPVLALALLHATKTFGFVVLYLFGCKPVSDRMHPASLWRLASACAVLISVRLLRSNRVALSARAHFRGHPSPPPPHNVASQMSHLASRSLGGARRPDFRFAHGFWFSYRCDSG